MEWRSIESKLEEERMLKNLMVAFLLVTAFLRADTLGRCLEWQKIFSPAATQEFSGGHASECTIFTNPGGVSGQTSASIVSSGSIATDGTFSATVSAIAHQEMAASTLVDVDAYKITYEYESITLTGADSGYIWILVLGKSPNTVVFAQSGQPDLTTYLPSDVPWNLPTGLPLAYQQGPIPITSGDVITLGVLAHAHARAIGPITDDLGSEAAWAKFAYAFTTTPEIDFLGRSQQSRGVSVAFSGTNLGREYFSEVPEPSPGVTFALGFIVLRLRWLVKHRIRK